MAQPNAAPPVGVAEKENALPVAAARFVRAEHLAPGYSPARHVALTVMIAAAIATLGARLAAHARPTDWALAPIFLVVANLIEWMVHRHPMHRPQPPRLMYRNHTLIHHLAFTHGQMPITRPAELGLVMMPWYTMIGIFVVSSPVIVVAGLLRGPGLAGIFLLAAVAYFLMYETLHALYHLPDATLNRLGIGRVRLFRKLQAHHTHHHVLGRMAHVNFNVTIPLMDVVLGTKERGD
jgi:hypothetical protein